MVFRRRDRPPIHVRAREFLLPRTGWRRALEYIGHRVRRIPDTPHRIALGFACGVMVSFTPFFGLHLAGSVALAWLLGGNMIAALIGQIVGNPVTLPFIALISMSLGRRILGTPGATGRDFTRVLEAFTTAAEGLWESFLSLFGHGQSQFAKVTVIWDEVMLPYFVGGLLPGLVTSLAFYWLVRVLVYGYQAARQRSRLRKRAEAEAAAAQNPPRDPADNSAGKSGADGGA